MIHFAICDDEPYMVEDLSNYLTEYLSQVPHISYQVSVFANGQALLTSGSSFDLIFLDVRMSGLDGLETAHRLRQRGDRSLLIFVTVLKECVFDSFAVEAYDFLVKPLDAGRFRQTMDRALRFLAYREGQSILIQRGTACERIPLSEIVYCEVLGRKVYIHQSSGRVTDYYDRLENLQNRLDGRFFRCHRSYLVNLAHVRGCNAGQVTLTQGGRVPVSRLRERDLTQALLRHMKERDF